MSRTNRWGLRGAFTGLVAASLLLSGPALAAGEAGKARPTPAAVVKPSRGHAQQKISPYAKASRERALAEKKEHRPNLRLSVRGAQKTSPH